MPRDWPDPRFPDKPDSAIALALVALVAVGVNVAIIWSAIVLVLEAVG